MTLLKFPGATLPTTGHVAIKACLVSIALLLTATVAANAWAADGTNSHSEFFDALGRPQLPVRAAGAGAQPAPAASAASNTMKAVAAPALIAKPPSTGNPSASAPASASATNAPVGADGAPILGVSPLPSHGGSGVSKKQIVDGLVLHGHWVIDVADPDGKVTAHRDFENAVVLSGQGFLLGLLGGYFVPADLMVALGGNSGNGPCMNKYAFCGLTKSLATIPGSTYCPFYQCSENLTAKYFWGGSFNGPFYVQLAGSIVANQAGSISSVFTILGLCGNTEVGINPDAQVNLTPGACPSATSKFWAGPLTSATITPVPVANGQVVQVMVTLSFQ